MTNSLAKVVVLRGILHESESEGYFERSAMLGYGRRVAKPTPRGFNQAVEANLSQAAVTLGPFPVRHNS